MTNENAMNNKNDPTAAVPPVPNGHGASNGTTSGETRQADTAAESTTKDTPSSKKKKKKHRHQHHKTPASTPSEAAAAPAADQHASNEPAGSESAEPAEPIAPQPPIEEAIAAAPIETTVDSLRLRMKIWTDHATSKRYLMPSAFMRDVDENGQPISDVMYAYALRDNESQRVTLTASEWQALPFSYFQEDGTSPRDATRPVDDGASYAMKGAAP